MADLGELLTGPAAAMGFGGMAGVVVGYTAKKFTKLAALLLGTLFVLVQLLAYLGFVTVHWSTVQSAAEEVWRNEQGATLADRAWEVLVANLPFGGGFVVGFALGFKLG
jgi:uncharacterized membrane protein (Fun14 family)